MSRVSALTMGVLAISVMVLGVPASRADNTTDFMQPYTVDANTVLLYHLDDTVIDEVGHHDGSLSGDATFATGRFGDGLSLDGSGDYVRAGNVHQNPSRRIDQGTAELWFKLTAAPTYFVLAGSGREYGGSWDDGFFVGRHASYLNTLAFGVWGGGGWVWADSGVTPESLVGQWHHVAGTWGSRGLEIWLDGQLLGATPYTGGLPNPAYETMLVGTDSWTWSTPGFIDEVRVSDVQRLIIPEPASFILGAAGLAVVLLLRRWR